MIGTPFRAQGKEQTYRITKKATLFAKIERAAGSDLVFNVYFDEVTFQLTSYDVMPGFQHRC